MARTVLISGAAGGLGRAVVDMFAAEGWRVVGVDRLPSESREGLEYVTADLLDEEGAQEAAEAAGDELKALVNLVGGFAQGGRVHETPVEDFERQFALNLRPTYLLTAAALPALMGNAGTVVCVGTRAALQPFAGAAGYAVSKAAVLAFVKALDAEYRDDGVRANAILPSVIDTPANRDAMPKADHAKWVQPAEIARVIHFLSTDASAPVSGAHVPVYGNA